MKGGRSIEVKVGDTVYAGALPYLPTRLALSGAFREACGLDAEGEQSSPRDGQDLVLVYAASIGLCIGRQLGLPSLRSFSRDLFGYGEACWEALADRGHDAESIVEAGRVAFMAIVQSIPNVAEVEEERANFPDQGESSTGSISTSA